jgi:hypothetical protein
MTAILRSKALDDLTHDRLINWGRWHRHQSGRVVSVHPIARMMCQPWRKGGPLPNDADAESVEYVLVSCHFAGGYGWMNFRVLLTEYVFRGPIDVRRKKLGKQFRTSISRRSYYERLATARAWASGCMHTFPGISIHEL